MSLSASIVFEVRLTGSDINGGGFKTGATGTDWSLQDAAQYSVTDGVTAGTSTITSATANFGTDVVGNLVYVQGGTAPITAAWYEIITRNSNLSITVDRSTGLSVGTGATLKIGGALASPGQAAAIATVAGHKVFIKYNVSPYVATSASTNIAAGCVSGTSTTVYSGYETTRSLYVIGENRPTFQVNAAVTGAILFSGANNNYGVQSIIVDGNSQTTSKGCHTSGEYFNVKAINCTSAGLTENSATKAIFCEATACTAIPIGSSNCFYCISHDNTTAANTGGFQPVGIGVLVGCIAYGNSRSGFFLAGSRSVNCVAYNNTEYGFTVHNNDFSGAINCIAENNVLYGYRANGGSIDLINCASYNNTSGRSSGTVWGDINPITGSGSFFVDATNKDFRLNNTASQGAACRAAGFPAAFFSPANLTANYLDVGAAQHQDSGGGSGGFPVLGGPFI